MRAIDHVNDGYAQSVSIALAGYVDYMTKIFRDRIAGGLRIVILSIYSDALVKLRVARLRSNHTI